jgi:hypothetical protein
MRIHHGVNVISATPAATGTRRTAPPGQRTSTSPAARSEATIVTGLSTLQ